MPEPGPVLGRLGPGLAPGGGASVRLASAGYRDNLGRKITLHAFYMFSWHQ